MTSLGLNALSWPLLAGLLLTAFASGLGRGFSGFGSALIFMPLASAMIGAKVASPLSDVGTTRSNVTEPNRLRCGFASLLWAANFSFQVMISARSSPLLSMAAVTLTRPSGRDSAP